MSNARRPEGVIRLLLVDDDPDDYALTKEVVAEMPRGPYELVWVSDYESAKEAISKGDYHVFLIDYRIGAKTGLDLVKETQVHALHGPVILLTGQSEDEIDTAAMSAGASDYLEKNRLNAVVLERAIRFARRQWETEQELERKVAERTKKLEAANEALLDADRRKDDFLATLAHELRNPLAPIRNALEILRLAQGNPNAVEQSRQMMDRQVRHMVRLIDDLLDVSRLARGKLRLTFVEADLNEVMQDAIEAVLPIIQKAGLTLEAPRHPEKLPIVADRVRLVQMLTNILGNAAKYTETGGKVTMSAALNEDHYVITIRDTGVGIPPELLPKIFDLFTQIDRTLNRSQGGLGIGLALVKRLVDMHGGFVTAHSEGTGTGAEFQLRLPLKPPETSHER
ncbi:hybrid sensor histidine kinase/response regulator [Zavarzinella formosa]|uniref:hybrid sensor histidine kinase/response regulator n=1 Tax=Zavarzinella formosa TaxID=360055 RepID=UPI0002F795BA|nr:HAMP domain-containing sensor histidine kinase [Zavarzinella formosa]